MTKGWWGLLSRYLPKGKFAHNVGVLVGGTAGSQVLMVLAAPLLTRLYTPDDFGILAVYVGLISVVTVISSMRYELAIPLPKTEEEAAHLVILSFLCVVLVTLLSVALVFFLGETLLIFFGMQKLSSYIWLLPLGIFLAGVFQILNYWAIRTEKFNKIAGARLQQALSTLLVQLGLFKFGVGMLLSGQAVGHGVGAVGLGMYAVKKIELCQIKTQRVLSAAKRYKKFPIYSTWSGLFNTLGGQLLPLFLAALFSPIAAGLFALAHRVLATPMSVIGTAVANVFLANAAKAHEEKRLSKLVSSIYNRLTHIAMPPAIILLISGPEIFSFVFGNEWSGSGYFSQWMAPWLYIVFVTSPLSTLFEVLEKQGQHLFFQMALLGARIISIVIGGVLIKNIELTVALYSIVSALFWVWFLYWVVSVTGGSKTELIWKTLSALCWGCICAAPLMIQAAFFNESTNLWIASLIASGLLVVARYLYFFRFSG